MTASRRLRSLIAQLHTADEHPPSLRACYHEVAGAAVVGGLVTASQLESYVRDGFVLCQGLVPEPVASAAVDSMWEQMAGPPKSLEGDPWAKDSRPRPQRDNRASWGGWAGIVDGPDIVATFTPQLLAVANALADAYEAASPFPSVKHPITAPPQTLAINVFPATPDQSGQQKWQWPGPHVDGGGERVEPRNCRIQHMTYLSVTGEHGRGGTVAWPGSSRKLESLYMSDKQVRNRIHLFLSSISN